MVHQEENATPKSFNLILQSVFFSAGVLPSKLDIRKVMLAGLGKVDHRLLRGVYFIISDKGDCTPESGK